MVYNGKDRGTWEIMVTKGIMWEKIGNSRETKLWETPGCELT